MAAHVSATELRKMSVKDLETELRDAQKTLKKLRLGVTLQKEKNTMKYTREKKHFARVTMALNEKRKEELQESAVPTKVSAPKDTSSQTKKS